MPLPTAAMISFLAIVLTLGTLGGAGALAQDGSPTPDAVDPTQADPAPLPPPTGGQRLSAVLSLPVLTSASAPPVAEVSDLLIDADGRPGRVVLSDGTFLRMGLDGKMVALPWDAAGLVADPETPAKAGSVSLNIARAYGQVIKPFLYDLTPPGLFSADALLEAPLRTPGGGAGGHITDLRLDPDGRVTHLIVELNHVGAPVSHKVALPIGSVSLERIGARGPTTARTSLDPVGLRALPLAATLDQPAPPADAAIEATPGMDQGMGQAIGTETLPAPAQAFPTPLTGPAAQTQAPTPLTGAGSDGSDTGGVVVPRMR